MDFAEQTTKLTRLEVLKNFLENMNYEIVYWDTDCVLIKYNENEKNDIKSEDIIR